MHPDPVYNGEPLHFTVYAEPNGTVWGTSDQLSAHTQGGSFEEYRERLEGLLGFAFERHGPFDVRYRRGSHAELEAEYEAAD